MFNSEKSHLCYNNDQNLSTAKMVYLFLLSISSLPVFSLKTYFSLTKNYGVLVDYFFVSYFVHVKQYILMPKGTESNKQIWQHNVSLDVLIILDHEISLIVIFLVHTTVRLYLQFCTTHFYDIHIHFLWFQRLNLLLQTRFWFGVSNHYHLLSIVIFCKSVGVSISVSFYLFVS